ncbi:MAG: hypothetical protein ABH812_00965 [bacterium]
MLHGGYTRIKNKSNKLFFREILSTFENSVKVLIVLFARPEDEWKKIEKAN